MSLSSLIVQREIASIREVEEALARQVLYGGDFVTNLFEVSRIEESALMPVVAESFGLLPAPPGELAKVPALAVRLIAAEVVAERALVPLEIGESLVVAVAEPLSGDAEQELTFALALPIEQRIAPLFRIRQALARDYGVRLERRMERLVTKVTHDGPRIASTIPPPLESAHAYPPPPRPPSVMPPPVGQLALPGRVAGTFVRQVEVSPARPVRRRRGPLTADVARGELEESAERDAILDVLFEFTRQFFDYTALFVVHGDVAEGRDAFGEGASRDKVRRIGVPLDLEGLFFAARGEKKRVRATPAKEGLDSVLMTDLERPGETECVIFPIVVRTRVVALLFGDGGPSGIDDAGVRDVEQLVESASGAFERVIMQRKLRGSDVVEGGVKAARSVTTESSPPTKVSWTSMHPVSVRTGRPSVEELAPPIRDLLMDPVAFDPRMARNVSPSVEPIVDARTIRDDVGSEFETAGDDPPPANVLVVRRPTGRPIPREEPALGGDSMTSSSDSVGGLQRSRSAAIARRAEAPSFEFGSPSMPSIVTENAFGVDETERELLAQIHGTSSANPAPDTTPDVDEPRSIASSAKVGSPRAESPPPMVAAPFASATSSSTVDSSSSVDVRSMPVVTKVRIDDGSRRSTTLVSGEPLFPAVDENKEPITQLVVVTPDHEIEPVRLSQLAAPAHARTKADVVSPPDAGGTPKQRSSVGVGAEVGVRDAALPDPEPKRNAGLTDPPLALSHRKQSSPASEVKPMPLSEQQISVPAHRPPSSRSDHSRILPSVIIDVSSEYVTLVDRVLAGPDDDAETNLLRAGGYAMPAIMAKFPGPIAIEPNPLEGGPLPGRVAECGPILRLVASQRRSALAFVLAQVESSDVRARFWATYLLTELVYPDAIDAAVGRVFDEEPRVRRVAQAAVRALAEAFPTPLIEQLGAIANTPSTQVTRSMIRRAQAVQALGETREPLAFHVLLALLDDSLEIVSSAARIALVTVTRQDFVLDTAQWTAWWEENKERHRLEWLIDSLTHEQRAIRAAAGEDLKTATKEYFGYYEDLPKRERERAQARYREWWESVGRVRFSRASTRGA